MKKQFIIFPLFLFASMVFFHSSAMASVITDNGTRDNLSSTIYQIADDSQITDKSENRYRVPNNSFDDGASLTYYYVTTTDPGVTQKNVTINGKTYS